MKKIIILIGFYLLFLVYTLVPQIIIHKIFTAEDVFEKASTGFVTPIGAYYFDSKTGIFNSDPVEGLELKSVFVIKIDDLDYKNIISIKEILDIVELENYASLWFRVSVIDSFSEQYKNDDNPTGAAFLEWVIDVNWSDVFSDCLDALTKSNDAIFLVGNSNNEFLGIGVKNFQDIEKNKEIIENNKEILSTKYKDKTNKDFQKSVMELKNKYPIFIDLQD